MAAAGIGRSFDARTPTAWQQTQAAHSARHAMTRRFIEEGALTNQAFARAQSNQIDGAVKLIATVALDHLNAASTSALTVVNLIRASQAFIDVPSATEQAAVSILDIRV